jgi:hypothetical protein
LRFEKHVISDGRRNPIGINKRKKVSEFTFSFRRSTPFLLTVSGFRF